MSAELPSMKHETHWMSWTLGLMAAPVLYVLLLPPVYYATCMDWSTRTQSRGPEWMRPVVAPYVWIRKHAGPDSLPDRYTIWWEQVYFGKRPLTYR